MSKHTPGPWYVGRKDENTGEIEVNSDGRPYVCLVFPGAIDDVTPANARLIAAAPDLLAELEMLSNVVEGCGMAAMPEVECRLVFARAAIAKATGK